LRSWDAVFLGLSRTIKEAGHRTEPK